MIKIVESGIKLNESRYFTTKTTGVSKYDNMLDNPKYFRNIKNNVFTIEYMTPMEYIEKCAKGFRSSVDRLIKSRTNKDSEKYADMMRNGTKFNMMYLNYSNNRFDQEGLHRAVAVMDIDPKAKIPVMVVDDWKSEKDFKVPLIYDEKGNVSRYSSS